MLCYFCLQKTGPDDAIEMHHPNKRDHPDWTEAAHNVCHREYHMKHRHFARWGAMSALCGRPGYILVMEAYPGFHRMGGLARAHSAKRKPDGTFM